MAKFVKKNFRWFLISFCIVSVVVFFLVKVFSAEAEEQIKISPSSYSSEWQNPEAALFQDLGPEAGFGDFNQENSAYVQDRIVEVSPQQPEEEEVPTTTEEIIEPEATTTKEITPKATTTEEVATSTEEITTPEATTTEEVSITTEEEILTTTEEATSTEVKKPSFFAKVWTKIKDFFNSEVKAEEATSTGATTTEAVEAVEDGDQQATTTEEVATTTEEVAEEPVEDEYQQIQQKILIISGFAVSEENKDKDIKNVQLRMSLAGRGGSGDKLIAEYDYQDSWQNLAEFNLENEISNALNGGYFLYALPVFENWEELEKLKIRFTLLTAAGEESPQVYLDALWLEVETTEQKVEEAPLISTGEKFILKSVKKDWGRNEEPEFEIEEAKKGLLSEITSFFEKKEISAVLVAPDGKEGPSGVIIQGNKIKITKANDRSFRPGLYRLKVKIKKGSEEFVREQDFVWGVLAINTSKSIYLPGEQAYLQMAALKDDGHTICDANLILTVVNPDGGRSYPTVERSGNCGPDNVTDMPDYFAYYQVGGDGTYQIILTNLDNDYEISDSFEVRESVPFDIERIGPTRIYPPAPYQVTLKIKANEGFVGQVVEKIPSGFEIVSEGPIKIRTTGNAKEIVWDVEWLAGEYYELSYIFDAPDISPYLYLLGPLEIGAFQEIRQWQIASDAPDFEDLHADGAGVLNEFTGVTQANLASNDNDNTKAAGTAKTAFLYATLANTSTWCTGATGISVTAKIYAYSGATGQTQIIGMYDGTTIIYGAEEQPSIILTAYSYHEYTSATNPAGGAWTCADIDNLQVVIDPNKPGAPTGDWRVTELWITVDYTPAAANQTPTVSSVALNGGSIITLTENTTTTVECAARITDNNGWDDIAGATSTIYRSGVTYTCAADNNNCYKETSNCALGATDTSWRDATCTEYIWFYADPTDASSTSYSAETWECDVEGWDIAGAYGTNTDAGNPELATQYALDIEGTIDYGTLSINESSTVQTTRATTTGNAAIGLNLYGVDMETSTFSIAVGQQEWASSTFTHSAAPGVDLGASPGLDYDVGLPKPITPDFSSTTIYWNILIPSGQAPGIYQGTNTISAVAPPGSACAGVVWGGYCWYEGAYEVSCDTVCTTHGGPVGTCQENDNTVCDLCKVGFSHGTYSCTENSFSKAPFVTGISEACFYRDATPGDCSATVDSLSSRLCACNE